jgi:hypothetical protein
MIPGIGGILLFQQNAIKLRIYKYDWLEEGFLKDKNREEKRDYLKDYLENSKEWNKVFYNNTSVVYVKN